MFYLHYPRYLLGFLYPHTHMRVIPYNRCVTSLGEKSPEEFLQAVSSVFRITEQGSSSDGEEEWGSCNGSSSHLLPLLEDAPPTSAPRSALSLEPPEAVVECSSRHLPGSPETSIVRGLVLSLDSESESDEDDSSSEMDDDEDRNSVCNSVANRFRGGSRSNSFESCTSIETSLSAKSMAEKRQQMDAASRLELEIDTEDAADPSGDTTDAQSRLVDTSSDYSATRKARRDPFSRLIGPRLPHTISMYFEGRWLDLSPLEAVEEKDGDPLSSLDIQVPCPPCPTFCLLSPALSSSFTSSSRRLGRVSFPINHCTLPSTNSHVVRCYLPYGHCSCSRHSHPSPPMALIAPLLCYPCP